MVRPTRKSSKQEQADVAAIEANEPAPRSPVECPNCGSHEVDADGDCTNCYEPAVSDAPPAAAKGRKTSAKGKAKGKASASKKAPAAKGKVKGKAPATKKTPAAAASNNLNLCYCGCGEQVTKFFKQGHDARFHGRVKKLADGRMTMAELKRTVEKYAVSYYQEAVGSHK